MNHTGVIRPTLPRSRPVARPARGRRRAGPASRRGERAVGRRAAAPRSGSAGSTNADARRAPRARRRRRAPGTRPTSGRGRASPRRAARSRENTHASSPCELLAPRRAARPPRPSRACRYRNRRRPRTSSTIGVERAEPDPAVGPTCTWPWSAVTTQRGVAGQRVEQRADELGRRPRARPGSTASCEPVRVRDLVDARVVRVDERRAAGDQRAHVLDEHRRWSASRGTRPPRRCALGEPGACGTPPWSPPGPAGRGTRRGAARRTGSGGAPAVGELPAEDVQHRALAGGSGSR